MRVFGSWRLMAVVCALGLSCVVGGAEIRNVTAKQRYPWNGKVDITYEVVGDVIEAQPDHLEKNPSLVVSVTNRVTGETYTAISAALSGDTGVEEGTHHVVWDLNAQGLLFRSDDVRFTVAYEEGSPMLYCIIDLSAGASASSYFVTYLAEPPPYGFNVDEYKTTKLVLRYIESGSFKMQETYNVTLTKPFYCGLFEVTQKQWELVMGNSHWSSLVAGTGPRCPAYNVSYNEIRGTSSGARWPTSSEVDVSSFLGKLQTRTGLNLDLPTEAQWEYACRAGGPITYIYGTSAANYMWYINNSDKFGTGPCVHEVGTKWANSWGLYDMWGNAWEWCLDWMGDLTSDVIDPKGAASGSGRVLRGGSCNDEVDRCTSSCRASYYSSYSSHYVGFRLVRTLSD